MSHLNKIYTVCNFSYFCLSYLKSLGVLVYMHVFLAIFTNGNNSFGFLFALFG